MCGQWALGTHYKESVDVLSVPTTMYVRFMSVLIVTCNGVYSSGFLEYVVLLLYSYSPVSVRHEHAHVRHLYRCSYFYSFNNSSVYCHCHSPVPMFISILLSFLFMN